MMKFHQPEIVNEKDDIDQSDLTSVDPEGIISQLENTENKSLK